MRAHVETITNLLLGAAYADKRLAGDEVIKIRELLLRLLAVDALPDALTQQIGSFNPAKFDATSAAASLTGLELEDRRHVLEMIAAIHESDDEHSDHEERYLLKVARGLGFSDSDIADLKLDMVEIDELDGVLAGLGE